MIYVFLLLAWWCFCIALLVCWKFDLLSKTWAEQYLLQTAVLIESDDWGPGDCIHAKRLEKISAVFSKIKDVTNRPAVLSADIVLAVPNTKAIKRNGFTRYERTYLYTGFPEILGSLLAGTKNGTVVPQLHGLEHLHGDGVTQLGKAHDARVKPMFSDPNWWDWETLASPLQAHYVDGTALPTRNLSEKFKSDLVELATASFLKTFGFASTSTVAPCYLWDEECEAIWKDHHIETIQTAGYRCTSRNQTGKYIQNPSLIRPGDRNRFGQTYLVRNVMFEPVDGKNTVQSALHEAKIAQRQSLPVVISTHRYNYTRSLEEFTTSLDGLNQLLCNINEKLPEVRFLSSPELGDWYAGKENPITNPCSKITWPTLDHRTGIGKVKGYLFRLWYRHSKFRLLSKLTGLIVPGGLFILAAELQEKVRWQFQSQR